MVQISERAPAARVWDTKRGPLIAAAHVTAGVVVLAGVLGQFLRPLAPDLGPAPAPEQWFDAAYLAQVSAYQTPLYVAGVAALTMRLAVPCLVAFTGPGRRLTERIVDRVGAHRPARAAAAVVVVVVIATDLVVLPLSFWAGYVHEGTFGFRTQGLGGWAYDWAVAKGSAWLVVTVLVLGGYALARRLPRAWPPVAGLAAAGLTAVLVFATPFVLEPLVFRTEVLPAGPVRDEVERVVGRSEVQVDRIVVADASRRTTKTNAYVSGLASSGQVVLYDTLVENHAPEEVGMVLAHELGHAQHADLLRGTVFAAAGVIALAYLLAVFARRRVRLGRQRDVADPGAAAVFLAVVVVVNLLSVPVQNLASRRAEAAADLAALQLTQDPATYLALQYELGRTNSSDPLPPRWAQLLWSTHPPPSARLEMGRWWSERSEP